jgi:hypothetical protein
MLSTIGSSRKGTRFFIEGILAMTRLGALIVLGCTAFQVAVVAQERVTLKVANRSDQPLQVGVQSVARSTPTWITIPAKGMKEITLVSPDDYILKVQLGRTVYSTPRMPLKQAVAKDAGRVLYASRIFGAPEGVLIDGVTFKLGGKPDVSGNDSGEFMPLPQVLESRLEQEVKTPIRGRPLGSSGGGNFGSSGR